MKRFVLFLSIVFAGFISISAIHQTQSPLSKLMRTMADDMKKARVTVIEGKKPKNFGKHYDKIYTAKPSSESKKGENFKEYATLFLAQMDRMKVATAEDAKTEYNALAKTCIRCHESYCPGPISMLRKLNIP